MHASVSQKTEMTESEWMAEGERRFGPDQMKWRFVCPSCGTVQSVQDYKDAGAPQTAIGFSCVGRWQGGNDKNTFSRNGRRCLYAGGGLIHLNPITVVGLVSGRQTRFQVFAFADE